MAPKNPLTLAELITLAARAGISEATIRRVGFHDGMRMLVAALADQRTAAESVVVGWTATDTAVSAADAAEDVAAGRHAAWTRPAALTPVSRAAEQQIVPLTPRLRRSIERICDRSGWEARPIIAAVERLTGDQPGDDRYDLIGTLFAWDNKHAPTARQLDLFERHIAPLIA